MPAGHLLLLATCRTNLIKQNAGNPVAIGIAHVHVIVAQDPKSGLLRGLGSERKAVRAHWNTATSTTPLPF